jgi:GDP-4-dehydro-6-deoxy-D-mannose reductase
MPVWLVTGSTGFLGRHVLEALARMPGIELLALGRRSPPGNAVRTFFAADLEEPESVARAIHLARPEVVIHAAGRTPPAEPRSLFRANSLATIYLLDSLRSLRSPARLVLAGSAAELGPVPKANLPVTEDHPCRPNTPYGLSKWLATRAGLAAGSPLEVVVARVFNPIGPGQPTHQAFGRFAATLASEASEVSKLEVGDLETKRDFVDVRDVARALVVLAQRGRVRTVYNVGTGGSHRVGEGLARLCIRSGRKAELRGGLASTAQSGPRDSRADIGRIFSDTGWRPEIPWEQSLDDLWDEAAARARAAPAEHPLPLTA